MRQRRPPPPWPPASPSRRALTARLPPSRPAEATSRTEPWHDSYVPVVFLITIAAVSSASSSPPPDGPARCPMSTPITLRSTSVRFLRGHRVAPTADCPMSSTCSDRRGPGPDRPRDRDVTSRSPTCRAVANSDATTPTPNRGTRTPPGRRCPLAPGLGLCPGATEATGAPEPLEPWEAPQAPEHCGAPKSCGAPGYCSASEVLGVFEVPGDIESPRPSRLRSPRSAPVSRTLRSPEALQPPESPDSLRLRRP